MTVVKGRALIVVLIVVLAATCVFAYLAAISSSEADGRDHTGYGGEGARVVNMEAARAFDVEDERKIVGFADDVFVGRVLERVDSKAIRASIPEEHKKDEPGPAPIMVPLSQFSVQVVDNIKGKLGGTVTVTQTGGYNPEIDTTLLLEGDQLLEPGETVLLVTRSDKVNDMHMIASQPYGDLRIKDKAKRDELVDKFKKAKDKEIDPQKELLDKKILEKPQAARGSDTFVP